MTLTDKELEELRAEQEKWMPDTAIVRRRVYVGDEQAGSDWTHEVVYPELSARFLPGFGSFQLVAERFQGINPYTVTVPWDTTIHISDQFVDEDGNTYEVRDVRDKRSNQTAIQCLADRIR